MKLDKNTIVHAARSAAPLTIKTYTLPHDTEEELEGILDVFLKEMGQEALKDPLFYCLRELAVNAKKANTKRIYFKLKELDLNDESQYQSGMSAFKRDTLDNIDFFLQKQKEAGLYIKIIFHNQGDVFNMYICNNSEMTRKEQMRVYDRIARSRAFNSMEEALATVLDDSEGAGLGLVILVLMLKKMGLNEDAFDIDVDKGETIARVSIPMSKVRKEHLHDVSGQLIKYIDSLPQFPENIARLQKMINDPEVDMADIARTIATDPALTGDLLKMVNSAAYMLAKRVENIHEAVMMVGLRGLRNHLFSYGTQKILGQESEKTRTLWQHSYRTAYYSYSIAKNILHNRVVLDDVYIGGILHDMGKIVFSSVHPNLIKNIERFCAEKNIPNVLFEDMAAGLSHAEIGGLIAEKWNFPEALIDAIKCHHVPVNARTANRIVVNTVYLANGLASHESENLDYEHMDPEILAEYGIRNSEHFTNLRAKLAAAFERENRMREG
jgi:putative nucleotidyltransferase with HDIG domain